MEIDKLAWIRLEGGRILSTRSRGKSVWYIPGGKREGDESDEAALIREIREELSIELRPETIRYFGTFRARADGHPEDVTVRMTCYLADYHGSIRADNEIEEVGWLNLRDIDRVSPVDKLIFRSLQQSGKLE